MRYSSGENKALFNHIISQLHTHFQICFMQYGDNGDGTISVLNFERTGAPDRRPNTIIGSAYVPEASQPGQLNLLLKGVGFEGTYWVLALGPVVDGKYEWSVVSDKTGFFLFVLTRDVKNFKKKYDKNVLKLLKAIGYKGFFKPKPIYQGHRCKYQRDITKSVKHLLI
jgi:lipocalin